ncbi:MAG: alpha/beta hydrolase [Pantoea sp.]|uniref:alpha/beta hydrolase n=1 Tax=Pantoea sp. TaxID=69393 RepID=UPI00239972CD|nr:alpha/beta hydrolase [Pantoea sp.]MDE1186798.1 alpha/beta hydrolase [Pantoea sp.]
MARTHFDGWLKKTGLTVASLAKIVLVGLVVIIIVFFIGRIYQSERGAPLHRWHTWSADEMSEKEIDRASFSDYQTREDAIFLDMKHSITDKLSDDEKTTLNRYYAQSRVYPARFQPDWNRSFILMPQGTPRGAVVLLHGLTDSPYSMRYLAEDYRQQGIVAVVPRLPGHGTAPGALTTVNWEQWLAVTRLAVREATRRAGPDVPLHLVGYSNGGALAMKYALDALNDPSLRQPQQIVLMSPMIGVTAFARFAGLAGLPSLLPGFAKAAWLNVVPEFNPYKYNSFPVKAARQSWLLTQALQQQILQEARNQQLAQLPPVLTFQSVMDSTVSTRAVVDSLYRYLQSRGNQLVIFDINQASDLRALIRPALYTAVSNLLPAAPRHYGTTVITNATPATSETVARNTAADQTNETVQPLNIAWPPGMYSLSHVAVPFPLTDSLYGLEPTEKNQSGISLGTISLRGETNTLIVGLDTLMRANSNPFFDYMMTRINHHIACSNQPDVAACLQSW